jgi:hypothetical protein
MDPRDPPTQQRLRAIVRCLGCLLLIAATLSNPRRASAQEGADVPCNVTAPNGVVPGSLEPQKGIYGNRLLAVGSFGLWPNGTVVFKPGGAGFLTRDGSLVMKFGWTLASPGKLQVTGRRLNRDASPLRASIGSSDDPRFKPSFLIFPTSGCWEVAAQIGDVENSKLTFVTRVVKIGEGPAGRWDPNN